MTAIVTVCAGFAGKREYSIGSIEDAAFLNELLTCKTAMEQADRFRQVFSSCQDCELDPICPGGCFYNASLEETVPDDPWFCDFFSQIARHVIGRVHASIVGGRGWG